MSMFYHKNLALLMRILFYLLVLNALTSLSYAKEDTVNLGETGFSSPIQLRKIDKRYPAKDLFGNVSKKINVNPIKFSYKSSIPKHLGTPQIRRLNFKKNLNLPIGAKIFVFSCHDEESIRIAPKVNFDYGLSIEYKSMNDIRDFKAMTGIKKPVQLANDRIVKAFGITSYPALITVHDDELEIQEGF